MKKKEEYLVDPNFFGTLREGLLDGEPITVAIEEIGPAMLAQLALDGPVQLEFKEPGSFARVSPPPPPSKRSWLSLHWRGIIEGIIHIVVWSAIWSVVIIAGTRLWNK